MCGDQLGGGESRQCWNVSEGDLDLLSESLGDDGVPGDGGGEDGVAGQQCQAQPCLVWRLAQSPESSGSVDGLGGQHVVGLDSHPVGVGQSGEVLLSAQEQFDNAGLYHRLRLVDRRTFSDHLELHK